VLASNVNNSGTASITVPNAPTTTARLLVEAADNYFFDISNANFAITLSPGPVITSFTPASGRVGTVVKLTGTGFTGVTAVHFNGTAATNVTGTATSITVMVAAFSTSGLLTVTTPLGTGTSATPFTVLPATATGTAAATATVFNVWPNPVGAKGLLHVSLPVPATAARLSLRNALGQLVRTRAFAGSTAELSTAGLAGGVYLLSVQADGHAPSVQRLVVE
jgi:IPT/TIG domain